MKDNELKRDIEFRAKESASGKFIYGYPRKTRLDNWLMYSNSSDDVASIDPKTISEYIGIDDADGNRVYEGDIVDVENDLSGKKYGLAVDWQGFVDMHGRHGVVHLDDLEALGYSWSLKPLKQ